MSKSKPTRSDKSRSAEKNSADKDDKPADGGWRETVESIAMAVILALLFRGFVAEAFVIPTGSMAPTLRGLHKDVQCPECGIWYQVGASEERSRDDNTPIADVIAGTCPTCRFTQPFDRSQNPNDGSFSGDRIIVSKFLYDFSKPQRWDVLVFKFPGDATQNYIKRLVGLPNETVRIQGGNIWVRQGKEGDFQIARKSPDKLLALLQLVSDTDHISQRVLDAQWPLEWFEGLPNNPPAKPNWSVDRTGLHSVAFRCQGQQEGTHWLGFRRIVPTASEWTEHLLANPPTVPDVIQGIEGELITDFYAYNTAQSEDFGARGTLERVRQTPVEPTDRGSPYGHRWVDDLALECLAEVEGSTGSLVLDLVRAGIHYRCEINVADGTAKLSRVDMSGEALPFSGEGKSVASVQAKTAVRGPGSYRIRLSNCDHQVLLWVNGKVAAFDGPTTYASEPLVMPRSTPEDSGDLQPAAIGSQKLSVRLSQLRVYRDKYYMAQKDDDGQLIERDPPYIADLAGFLKSPGMWAGSRYFSERGAVEFQLGPEQFFPLGDNSPASQDARTWPRGGKIEAPHHVERDLLIGKAMFVYWPHTWNAPVPYLPNPSQMRPIR